MHGEHSSKEHSFYKKPKITNVTLKSTFKVGKDWVLWKAHVRLIGRQ